MKRSFDYICSAILLIALSPIILATAILVRVKLGSPVLFRQMRPGLNGKPFLLLKFRTMRDAFTPGGEPLPDGDRLTTVGAKLRSLSLDELPQLWNILKGDMSFVGPRPLLMEYLPLYTAEQARRHDVRPGITGWAQVNGRNALSWEEKFALDIWYVNNHNFLVDLRILLMTSIRLLSRSGINNPGSATMPIFRGNVDCEGSE